MPNLGIRTDASGTFGALTLGGVDKVTVGNDGIQAGSYKAGSIVAADFADGALIENAPVGIGYGPGAGGTVTQATSKSTPVTLNKPTGQITMNAASLAAGGSVAFTLNNSLITNTTPVTVVINGGVAGFSSYEVICSGVINGAAGIILKNVGGSPLAEAVQLMFVLTSGATT